jgi:hypothetical protein
MATVNTWVPRLLNACNDSHPPGGFFAEKSYLRRGHHVNGLGQIGPQIVVDGGTTRERRGIVVTHPRVVESKT